VVYERGRYCLMIREELARLGVPSLFLWGHSDAFAPPSSGRAVAARMPAATIEVIPDTGHLPHLERPDTVAAAIIHFLGDSEGEPLAATSRRPSRRET
jgi:pimeloyl-ACP methyl ester carboxylesterase